MATWQNTVIVLLFCQLCVADGNYKYKYVQRTNYSKKILKKHHYKEGSIQLVDGRRYNEGNVEIYHLGRWGGICDDEFDEREANVICRQLGYSRALRYTNNSHFGPTRRKYWMDDLYCSGKESKLGDCRFSGWGLTDCSPSEAAGVICEDKDVLKAQASTSYDVFNGRSNNRIQDLYQGRMYLRLAGGRVHDEGRVEVRFGNSDWGVICGDGWSLLEASVVCRQLGFGYANAAIQTDFFGGNRSTVILNDVQCRGNEGSLDHCIYEHSYTRQCPGRRENIAAVVCSQDMADLVIDHYEIQRTAHLEDKQLYYLQCAMEENCLSSTAYRLQQENRYNWHLQTRRLLRFTARIANTGTADFRPAVPKHLWQFHQCHRHYHSMEVFATFDVLDQYGHKVADGHKASFCLEDNQCLPGIRPFYACANYGDQGISVNCSDVYKYNIDCQWVDITDLTPGYYTFKVSINPEFKIPEMTFDNNAAVCNMYYTQSSVSINDCTIERP